MTALERLADAMLTHRPMRAARVLERFPAETVAGLLDPLATARAGTLLHWMSPAFAAVCAAHMQTDRASAALAELAPNAAAALLRRIERARRDQLVDELPRRKRNQVAVLLANAPHTAGALMDPSALALPGDVRVADAMDQLRAEPDRFARYLYVVERGGQRLLGVLSLWELLTAPPDTQLSAIMHTRVATLRDSAPEDTVIAHPGWTDWYALPVVDRTGALLGAVGHEVAHRLARGRRAPRPQDTGDLALEVAELLWLGLSGVTRGLAATIEDSTSAARTPTAPPPDDPS